MPRKQNQHNSSNVRRLIPALGAVLLLSAAVVYLLVDATGAGGVGGAGDAGGAGASGGASEGGGGSETRSAAPPIAFEPGSVDFGEMPMGITRTQTVQVVNQSASALHVLGARSSCGCMKVDMPTIAIQPGRSALMTLHMDSQEIAGERTVRANVIVAGYDQPAYVTVRRTTLAE